MLEPGAGAGSEVTLQAQEAAAVQAPGAKLIDKFLLTFAYRDIPIMAGFVPTEANGWMEWCRTLEARDKARGGANQHWSEHRMTSTLKLPQAAAAAEPLSICHIGGRRLNLLELSAIGYSGGWICDVCTSKVRPPGLQTRTPLLVSLPVLAPCER
eukprot:SAG11_NODE_6324_length_1336_cov_1.606306_2_plen_155_part_00